MLELKEVKPKLKQLARLKLRASATCMGDKSCKIKEKKPFAYLCYHHLSYFLAATSTFSFTKAHLFLQMNCTGFELYTLVLCDLDINKTLLNYGSS